MLHIWSDNELVTLILGGDCLDLLYCQVEDVCEASPFLPFLASLQQHLHLKHCVLSWLQLCALSESALLTKQNDDMIQAKYT